MELMPKYTMGGFNRYLPSFQAVLHEAPRIVLASGVESSELTLLAAPPGTAAGSDELAATGCDDASSK